ncbi:S1 RNA-binding domain-containing protein [Spiroplasma cantharicola]|uniref:S1 RNA binding domain protein n=1 Tax=Spiroplasma cantharicola TaxID=362837 RepID=A0A0M4K1Z1_9MOLU|nr:S1 RNA-binding domain-containing protein [Spiroplasma cantharicola]ALD66700.1 S1 RNA binding domain protein [Spiroplasma cantharicola]
MLNKGQKVEAKITAIVNYGAFCEIQDENEIVKGLIHISEISDFFVKNIDEFLVINESYEVEVIEYLEDKKQVKLSYKANRPQLLKSSETKIAETKSGFDNLKNSVESK